MFAADRQMKIKLKIGKTKDNINELLGNIKKGIRQLMDS
mgnify:CR=1 FL=1